MLEAAVKRYFVRRTDRSAGLSRTARCLVHKILQ
jgi:hypothetical protein